MSTPNRSAGATRLREAVEHAKNVLSDKREAIRKSHALGLSSIQVCAKLTAAADAAIISVWNDRLGELTEKESQRVSEGCVLVAHGGYGRRQLAPWSDIDLMVLHTESCHDLAERLARELTHDVFDLGMDMGHSLRTTDEALRMAREDPVIATSLIESRPLVGSQPLFDGYFAAFSDAMRRRKSSESARFVTARANERRKYGETVYLLEPNLKRSRGALRDVHLLRWLWFLQTGVSDLDRLRSMGVISKFDHHRVCSSRDFLLRVRNDLHFHAKSGSDALNREEQLRITERFGYQGTASLKPVEQFMRDYFRHAGHVWFLASRLSDLTTPRSTVERVLDPVMSLSVEKDYKIGLREISATHQGREKLRRRIEEVFRLAELARTHDRRIDQETWYAIYRAAPEYGADLSNEACERFLGLLTDPTRLGILLRKMHELGVLEKALPPFSDARFLLQFNQYHKFTVDEHCIRTVEEATRFADREDLLGKTYRNLVDKRLLHLALLLHDLGKGHDEDHSVVGEAIALRTGARLRLSDKETQTLALLVRRHLDMSQLAFRRDTADPEVIKNFADWIGTPERLSMLFVLTCADMAAVGPGVLNDWKVEVLADLYSRTLDHLEQSPNQVVDRRGSMRTSVWQFLKEEERDDSWYKRQFAALPESFVSSRSPASIAGAMRRMRRLDAEDECDAWGGYREDGGTLEMIAVVSQGAGKGVFARMAGALSSKGLKILAAETSILEDDILLLRFMAEDPRGTDGMNAAEANGRVRSIAASMTASIKSDTPPKFPSVWGAERQTERAALSAQPDEVRIDTKISDQCAIIEVFTVDRTGLLYELARALHDLELVIRFARIATSLDQVVDVFYVTERNGQKPTHHERLDAISHRLKQVIEA